MSDTDHPKSHLSAETLQELRELQGEDDPVFFVNFLNIVRTIMTQKVNLLRQAIEKGSASHLAAEAHALKSSCLNSGMEIMGELCQRLEQLGRSGSLEGADEVFEALRAEHQVVEQAISRLPEFRNGNMP